MPAVGSEAVDPPGGSHEDGLLAGYSYYFSQLYVAPVAAAASTVDQATGVAGTFVLTGQVVSMESASGTEIASAWYKGEAQGVANTLNGRRTA